MNSVLRVKKQKTNRKDALVLLTLMMEDRFPRIWVPSPENLDVRQLLGTGTGWYKCAHGS